jgi:thymidylate synthase
MTDSFSTAWIQKIYEVLNSGDLTSPRGVKTYENISNVISIDMSKAILCIPERRLGTGFLCFEPFWILSGDNQLSSIKPYAPLMERFTDDGFFLSGAYGPKLIDQLPYIINLFKKDSDSRQGIVNIWREKPGSTKDCPCTCLYQFFIRNDRLHMLAYMRSNDLYLGTPYDIFSQTMIAYGLCLILRDTHYNLTMGNLHLHVGSIHIYDTDRESIKTILSKYINSKGVVKKNLIKDKTIEFDYTLTFQDLKDYLHSCSNILCNGLEINNGFLRGLQPKDSKLGVFK